MVGRESSTGLWGVRNITRQRCHERVGFGKRVVLSLLFVEFHEGDVGPDTCTDLEHVILHLSGHQIDKSTAQRNRLPTAPGK